jgi:hypothetical protein
MSASNRLNPVFLALIAVVLDVPATALFSFPAPLGLAATRSRIVISVAFCRRDFGEFVWSEMAGEDI